LFLKWRLKFVKLFFIYNVILAEHTVASHTSSDITSECCGFTNFIQTYSKHKSIVIETFHRKIGILVDQIEKRLHYTIFSTQKLK
jgi:hypothetical protein